MVDLKKKVSCFGQQHYVFQCLKEKLNSFVLRCNMEISVCALQLYTDFNMQSIC